VGRRSADHVALSMSKYNCSWLVCLLQVLGLLWNLAHSEDVPTDIMDLALSAHIKILDYSCSQVLTTYLQYYATELN